MNSKAISQLLNIAKIEGISREDGSVAREKALNEWIKDWIVEVSTSQPIIKSNLSLDEEEFVRYHMATKLGDKLMEESINLESQPTRITAKMTAIRR